MVTHIARREAELFAQKLVELVALGVIAVEAVSMLVPSPLYKASKRNVHLQETGLGSRGACQLLITIC